MRQSAASRIWDGLWLALALIPLAIFWSGRNEVFQPPDGTPDDTLAAHLGASAVYLATVVFTSMWLRGPWRHRLPVRGLAFVTSVAAAMWFSTIGGDAVREASVAGLGLDVAVFIIVYLAASNAAWIILAWIASAIRRSRAAKAPMAPARAETRTTPG